MVSARARNVRQGGIHQSQLCPTFPQEGHRYLGLPTQASVRGMPSCLNPCTALCTRRVTCQVSFKCSGPRIGEITCQDRLYQRSLYGYILVYNRLPQPIADSPSVSSFQARLTHLAKQKASNSDELWRRSFHDCSAIQEMFYPEELGRSA